MAPLNVHADAWAKIPHGCADRSLRDEAMEKGGRRSLTLAEKGQVHFPCRVAACMRAAAACEFVTRRRRDQPTDARPSTREPDSIHGHGLSSARRQVRRSRFCETSPLSGMSMQSL